jgi:hypothetical protein
MSQATTITNMIINPRDIEAGKADEVRKDPREGKLQ